MVVVIVSNVIANQAKKRNAMIVISNRADAKIDVMIVVTKSANAKRNVIIVVTKSVNAKRDVMIVVAKSVNVPKIPKENVATNVIGKNVTVLNIFQVFVLNVDAFLPL